jgi:large subunit ribosomal protein L9
MKLILKQTVDNLGEAGEVVTVKAGYGRNYLIPQGLAYVASEANMARLEEEQARAAERKRRDFLEARRRASQLEGVALVFSERAGEDGKLFGSVSAADVVEKLNAGDLDFELEKRAIVLDEPIKEVGDHSVVVKLHAEVLVDVPVRVDNAEG